MAGCMRVVPMHGTAPNAPLLTIFEHVCIPYVRSFSKQVSDVVAPLLDLRPDWSAISSRRGRRVLCTSQPLLPRRFVIVTKGEIICMSRLCDVAALATMTHTQSN